MSTTVLDPTVPRTAVGVPVRPRLHWVNVLRWTALLGSVAMVIRMGLSGWEDIRAATTVLAGRQLLVVAVVVALEVAWAWSLAQVTRTALRAVGGEVTRLQALRISMAGFTLSRVVPTGGAAGGVFAAHELTRLGNRGPVALAGMVVSWAVSMLTLATLVLGAAATAVATGRLPLPSLLPVAIVFLLLLVGAGVAARALRSPLLRRRISAAVERGLRRFGASSTSAAWEAPLEAVSEHLHEWRRLAPVVAWSGIAWTLDMAALWLMFSAFGYPLPVGDLALGYGFANLLSALPELTPGWLGVYEAAVAATYTGLGAPAGVALAAVMAYRVASFWLPVAAGVVPVVTSLRANRSRVGPQAPTMETEAA